MAEENSQPEVIIEEEVVEVIEVVEEPVVTKEPQQSNPTKQAKPGKPRDLLSKKSKRYRKSVEKLGKNLDSPQTLASAIKLLKSLDQPKFDSTVELHIRLGVDVKHADQIVRGTVALPHGTGKAVKIYALVESGDIESAMKAGAIEAEEEKIIEQLEKGQLEFDILVATPAKMPLLGKYARVLGPRGLMPSPKAGTVTQNPIDTIGELLKGRVEYKTDSYGIIHIPVGKISFEDQSLTDNAHAVISAVKSAKPSSSKGKYLISAYLTSTMSPSLELDTTTL
ncbi:50S ribosomal protein L1 [Candidatus Saccharibacteria bacterium]|nr:50S ribosomal protein L1 [Candidatus Saccharibacteria bacterium]MCB9834887.1 50S ribosomal protein L1 [Candidatus Nomurabacteria bacterium]